MKPTKKGEQDRILPKSIETGYGWKKNPENKPNSKASAELLERCVREFGCLYVYSKTGRPVESTYYGVVFKEEHVDELVRRGVIKENSSLSRGVLKVYYLK